MAQQEDQQVPSNISNLYRIVSVLRLELYRIRLALLSSTTVRDRIWLWRSRLTVWISITTIVVSQIAGMTIIIANAVKQGLLTKQLWENVESVAENAENVEAANVIVVRKEQLDTISQKNN